MRQGIPTSSGRNQLRDAAHVHRAENTRFSLTNHTPSRHERNRRIRARYAQGEITVSLAKAFGISQQRASQILRGKRK